MKISGSVYYRRDTRKWCATLRLNSSRHRQQTDFATKTEAKNALQRWTTELHGGRPVTRAAEQITVGEILDCYLTSLATRHRDKSPSHAANVKALRAAWGSLAASDLTVAMVDEQRKKWLAAGKSEATTDRYLQALRAAFRLSIRRKQIATRPEFDLTNPKNARQGFTDEPTFRKIYAALPELHADVSLFAYRSAWRRDEVESLTWEQIDTREREARLWDSKNDEPRVLPLEGELWNIISRRAAARRYETTTGPALSGFVFHDQGMPLGDWRKRWDRACRAAGAPNLLFHDLRRSAIKNMVDAGIPQVTIMAISGHKSDAVFRRYAIRTTKETRKALSTTERRLRENPAPETDSVTTDFLRRTRSAESETS